MTSMRRPSGMTREAIDRATREAREETERLRRSPEIAAKAAAMHERALAMKADLERKAADGDKEAARTLRQVYPEDFAELDAAAAVLARPGPRAVTPPQHWQEREPGDDSEAA